MKVLQVGKFYPPYWGGMETAVQDLSETLVGKVDLEVLVSNSTARREQEVRGGVPVTRLANLRTLFSQPITPGLFGELRSRKADIVHLHEPNPLALTLFLASGNPARLVIHYHSDIVRQKWLLPLYRPVLERGLRRAEVIIVGSPQLRDGSPVLERWRHKCAVVPFGIDLVPFLQMERRRSARTRVLAVGRLSYYKGFQYLISAAAQTDAEFVIAGEGEMRPKLEAQISELGLGKRVTLEGRVSRERLLELYASSDIFCLPSCEPSEAFGLAMVEAMAAGLPVVSTDLPTGVRLVNTDGTTGFVVPPGDSEALATRLRQLVGDSQLGEALGRAGRERAQTMFSREVMGRAVLQLYQRGTGGAKP